MYDVEVGGRPHVAFTYDGHVHTDYSHDADAPVAQVLELAGLASLDAIMLTDHGTSSAERDVRGREQAPAAIVGAEIGGDYGHALTWGFLDAARRRAEHLEDMPGLGAAVHGERGLVVLAHPGWFIPGLWVNPRYYLQADVLRHGGLGETIDAVEIWNATYPAPTDTLIDAWLRVLDAGVFVPVTCGTDFHRVGQVELGAPRNVALCPAEVRTGGPDALRACLFEAARLGRQYLTDGPIVDLRVDGRTYGEVVALDRPGEVRVTARAVAWSGGTLRIRVGHTDVRSYELAPGLERRVAFALPVRADTYVFAEVERAARVERKPRISALTNPVRLDVAPRVADWRGPTVARPTRIPAEFTRGPRPTSARDPHTRRGHGAAD